MLLGSKEYCVLDLPFEGISDCLPIDYWLLAIHSMCLNWPMRKCLGCIWPMGPCLSLSVLCSLGEQSTDGTGTYNYKGPNSANLPHVLVSSKWQSCVLSGVSPLIIPWPLAATHTQLCSSWWLLFWWGLKGSGGRPRVKTDLRRTTLRPKHGNLLWCLDTVICLPFTERFVFFSRRPGLPGLLSTDLVKMSHKQWNNADWPGTQWIPVLCQRHWYLKQLKPLNQKPVPPVWMVQTKWIQLWVQHWLKDTHPVFWI